MGGFAFSKIKPRGRSLLALNRSRTPSSGSDSIRKAPANVPCSSGSTEVVENKTLALMSDDVNAPNNRAVAKAPSSQAGDDASHSCSSTEASSAVTYESSNDDSTLSSIHSTSLTSFAQNLSPPQIEFLTKDSCIVTSESSNDDSTLSSIHSTSLTSFAQNLSPPHIEFLADEHPCKMMTQATPSASIICRGVLKKSSNLRRE